ncbi:MAG: sulfite exporter TauE/SafE family protein [Bacillota bacterium]|nr:sulfite exporter TauE/SafE family protein [Bacillota bacterium]
MEFTTFILIGFAAQLIDGTLGMAYGVSCRTFLRSMAGLPPVVASAVVHCAEIPVTLVSGISHLTLKNVDKRLLLQLVVPGAIGGVLGAWFLTSVGDGLEPFIDVYLIIMGGVILFRALGRQPGEDRKSGGYVYPLGLAGGFLDATGGGGWGPVVTSTMIAGGHNAKKTIGSVNAAEFLVTIAETTAFAALMVDFGQYFRIILGLVIGGVIAAPLAAYFCTRVPIRPLMGAVGVFIICLNVYNLISALA